MNPSFSASRVALVCTLASALVSAPAFSQGLPQVIKIGSIQPLTGSSAPNGALGKAVITMRGAAA